MAANSTTIREAIRLGDQNEYLYVLEFVPSTSYPTGGEVVDASANTRFTRIFGLTAGGYVGEFIPSTQKILFRRQKDPANAGGADIPAPEVANAVDLSGTTFYCVGIGS